LRSRLSQGTPGLSASAAAAAAAAAAALALHCTPAGLSLSGRKVAVFGCGDQHGYGDYFCDAMEELYSSFAAAGCDMVGHWPTDGYEHSESKVGLGAFLLSAWDISAPWY
jgi:hypothetical protein